MQTLSIHSTEKEVEQKIVTYLKTNGFRQVNVNKATREITGKRRNAFLMTDNCHFRLKTSGEALTHVDIIVNPDKKKVSSKDIELEAKLQENMYMYF